MYTLTIESLLNWFLVLKSLTQVCAKLAAVYVLAVDNTTVILQVNSQKDRLGFLFPKGIYRLE